MRIAAVSTVKNEADIIGATLTYLYNEGVANVYIADGMSSDGTRDVLSGFPCKIFDDDSPIHRQPYWISLLADMAYDDGNEWVIAWDADEFVYAPNGATIAEQLAEIPENVGVVRLPMWHHLDYNMREPNLKPLCKVAFRACPHPTVANGNHSVTNAPGGTSTGELAIREIQFRGFDHFVRKIGERCATLDPSLPAYEGTHMTQYRGWTKEQLEPEWQKMVDKATVLDPIPVRR